MPSLIRFLVVLAVIAGIGYGGLVALTFLVKPEQREMTVKIPPKRLDPR